MTKLLLSAAVFGLFLAAPANALETMKCDDASMMKMQTDMDAMTDPKIKVNKDMAMKHMEMASAAMKDNKMDDCSLQMGMASISMTLRCDDASMKMMQTEMDAMTVPAKKADKNMVMKHMDLAKAAMMHNKPHECIMHMGEAMDAIN